MHEHTLHLDSTFLGVHLDSTSLGVHLDSTSRKSCGPLGGHEQGGTGTAAVDWAWEHPGKVVEKFFVPLQDLQEKDPLIWVVQGSRWWRGEILGSWRGLGEESCQGGGWSINE